MTNEQDWYSVDDVSKLVGVTRSTVYRWIEDKQIPEKYIQLLPSGLMRIHRNGILRDRPRRKRQRKVKSSE